MACNPNDPLDLRPLIFDWYPVTLGDTYPATNFVETGATSILSRVRVKIKDSAGTLLATLDSDGTGITLNSTAAGSWDWNIDAIATSSLAAGNLRYDLEVTDDAGTIRTEFSGSWRILTQVTD